MEEYEEHLSDQNEEDDYDYEGRPKHPKDFKISIYPQNALRMILSLPAQSTTSSLIWTTLNGADKQLIKEQKKRVKVIVDIDESSANSFAYGNNVAATLKRDDFHLQSKYEKLF